MESSFFSCLSKSLPGPSGSVFTIVGAQERGCNWFQHVLCLMSVTISAHAE